MPHLRLFMLRKQRCDNTPSNDHTANNGRLPYVWKVSFCN